MILPKSLATDKAISEIEMLQGKVLGRPSWTWRSSVIPICIPMIQTEPRGSSKSIGRSENSTDLDRGSVVPPSRLTVLEETARRPSAREDSRTMWEIVLCVSLLGLCVLGAMLVADTKREEETKPDPQHYETQTWLNSPPLNPWSVFRI